MTAYILYNQLTGALIIYTSYRTVGNQLLPLMEYVWGNVGPSEFKILPEAVKESLMEAFLSASRLHSRCFLRQCFCKSLSLLLDYLWSHNTAPLRMRAMTAYYRSVSLRSIGRHERSDAVLCEMIRELDQNAKAEKNDVRLHCVRARLLLSRTENAIMRKDFNAAQNLFLSWEAQDPPSRLEVGLVRMKNTAIGRIWRYMGQFEQARQTFEPCLSGPHTGSAETHIKHHLADVYCELGRPQDAIRLISTDINQLRAGSLKQSKAFRRLALPLAEAYMRIKELQPARDALEESLAVYQSLTEPDVTDQLGHVRAMIGLARIHWYKKEREKADINLRDAMDLANRYVTFTDGCFDIAFIHLFHCLIKRHLAAKLLDSQPPRYYMAGTGTYLLSELSVLMRLEADIKT